jgi:hypothetical protein
MTIPDDMNELTDVNIDRVDLVGKAANGTRFLLAKSAATDAPSLIDADTVRELIKEADADESVPDLDAALHVLTKAGRALSSANEATLRSAADAIQKVLASLPAPEEAPIEKEAPVAEETTENLTKDEAAEAPAEAVIEKAEEAPESAPEAVEKADSLMAVFDAAGKLVGVIKPNALTPVDGGQDDAGELEEEAQEEAAEEAPEADAAEAEPFEESADEVQPEDGAPTETLDDDAAVIPGTETIKSPVEKTAEPNVTQAPDIAALLKEALTPLAEKIAEAADLAKTVEVLKERVEAYGREPDDRNSPKLNGSTGQAGLAKRAAETDELSELAKSVETAKATGNPAAYANAQQAYALAQIKDRFSRPLGN